MRLTAVSVTKAPPIAAFGAADLADVVVIAGPNGVGKTRLVAALLQALQAPQSHKNIVLRVQATNEAERSAWGKPILDTSDQSDAQLFVTTLHRNRLRTNWTSSVVQFESDRSIQRIDPYTFTWDVVDPWSESIGWNYGFNTLRARFQDTLHSLFRKVQSQNNELARRAKQLQREGQAAMPLDFPDPLAQFKDAFLQLLAPKRLLDADAKAQQLMYEYDGKQFSIDTLSSGEREVVNIVFDFLLRGPSDCIIFFDEPELHLHPELSYKLLQTLRSVGTNNQFFFCTHSPDIITASLDQSVLFLSPPRPDGGNQAVPMREDDDTNQALRLLGQSIGVVSLGRRIVLIEGTRASLDKQVYGSLLKNRFPTLVLAPSGSKEVIRSFATVVEHVLDRTIWGVDFFMLCDRDALPVSAGTDQQMGADGRLRVLPRYHLENYFLDENIIAACFDQLEAPGSWLRDPAQVGARLKDIAESTLSYAAALRVAAVLRQACGNVDLMPKGAGQMTLDQLATTVVAIGKEEAVRVQEALDSNIIDSLVRRTAEHLRHALTDPVQWKIDFPGRPIINQFAAVAGLEPGRMKTLYINTAGRLGTGVFDDIIEIFRGFAERPAA